MDMLWYAHKHGLVPDQDYEFLTNNCSSKFPAFMARGKWIRKGARWHSDRVADNSNLSDECKIVQRRFIATTSRGLSQSWDGSYLNVSELLARFDSLSVLPGARSFH